MLSKTALRELAIADVWAERDRQETLKAAGRFTYTCADPEMLDLECLAVLMEEVGEAARAVLEGELLAHDRHNKALYTELIQVAAVAVAWAERLAATKEETL